LQTTSNFKIYNASAGSGKTFTLVKEYLKIVLQTTNSFAFQKILAITFTNKAAGEMKERILKNLRSFSEGSSDVMLDLICEELALSNEEVSRRSARVLDAILQNYSAFSITTIDSFTHTLIKSFAFDLGLPQNFDVELDVDALLKQAVDVLISKIGVDEHTTKLLVNYSLQKLEDNKSWDISIDILEISKILFNEEDVFHLSKFPNKTYSELNEFQEDLKNQRKKFDKKLVEIGEEALRIIEEQGLEYKNFLRGSFPNHFVDLTKNKAKFFNESTLKKNVENYNFYAKSTKPEVVASVEAVLPKLIDLYYKSEITYRRRLLCQFIQQSWVPLVVLDSVNKELNQIKEENNIRLNSEFNQIISKNIQNQSAPFIYERLGQRYQYYFIDEMQDTSTLQWNNLIPLLSNALSQEDTQVMLVGDGKQAIYRWRGGNPDQFIKLSSDTIEGVNPFMVSKELRSLKTNHRSYSEVINFNNNFFKHISSFIENPLHKDLFQNNSWQEFTSKKGGYVSLTFLEKEEDKELNKLKYAKEVYETIQKVNEQFLLSEVCVIVRKNSEAKIIANYLSEQNIHVVTSESLLLSNSVKVEFVVNFLQWLHQPNDDKIKFKVLAFIADLLELDIHEFCSKNIGQSPLELIKELRVYGVFLQKEVLTSMPLYEKVEHIVKVFDFMNKPDAYVQFFLDEILNQQQKQKSIPEFLEYWDLKKDKLSIAASESDTAATIMTIHKSKGLEFPVVIAPGDVDCYENRYGKVWLDDLEEIKSPFTEILISQTKKSSQINSRAEELMQKSREQLLLDNYNVLYVALTRAVEQLYVITENKKKSENRLNFSDLFRSYLKNKDSLEASKFNYSFGDEKRVSTLKNSRQIGEELDNFILEPWQSHNITLLPSSSKFLGEKKEAIDYGNLIHEMMAEIYVKSDVQPVISRYYNSGFINESTAIDLKAKIFELINHPSLKKYFSEGLEVFTEREIVTQSGEVVIPDRLVFLNEKEVVLIDYKTGKKEQKYSSQLNMYKQTLNELGYKVTKKILIYIGESIIVEEI